MCRIIAVKGKINKNDLALVLAGFRKQSEAGTVPQGEKPGHHDGWGFVVYKNKEIKLYSRSGDDASQDPKYIQAADKILKTGSDILIGHLRKASVGQTEINNAHPFVHKNFSFCHNGKIINSDKISVPNKFKKSIKGTTDSERLFYSILNSLDQNKNLKVSFGQAIKKITKDFDYTGLNCLFSDGNKLIALRQINLKNKIVKEKKLLPYYSLFVGDNITVGYKIIASEKIEITGVKWQLLKNGEMLVI
ncbi:MAG: class II glutamine amidotransferase [Patescibacteria group bacterium]